MIQKSGLEGVLQIEFKVYRRPAFSHSHCLDNGPLKLWMPGADLVFAVSKFPWNLKASTLIRSGDVNSRMDIYPALHPAMNIAFEAIDSNLIKCADCLCSLGRLANVVEILSPVPSTNGVPNNADVMKGVVAVANANRLSRLNHRHSGMILATHLIDKHRIRWHIGRTRTAINRNHDIRQTTIFCHLPCGIDDSAMRTAVGICAYIDRMASSSRASTE